VSQALSPNTIKRLAFIRFLYGQGLEQAVRPQPLAAAALLSFHDAVEMFLLLAAEHLGVNLDMNTIFDGYWTQVAAQASVQLPARNAMRRMNNSRVNFKHHGSIPSATDLDQFRGDVTTFFTDATPLVFAADFNSFDMSDLVTHHGARTLLREAGIHADKGDYTEALALLSEAVQDLLIDYRFSKRTDYASTAYDIGQLLRFGMHPDTPWIDPTWDRAFFSLVDTVHEMQDAMRVLAMGVDYPRYARFQMLVPLVLHPSDGHREVQPQKGLQVGNEEYQFCKQFVIETALHLAETDFDLDLYSLRQNETR
jgi:hypothetical protein